MTLETPRWINRILVACATAMVVIGGFGLHMTGLKADWMAYYAAGNFLIDHQISNIYDINAMKSWQSQIIGSNVALFMYAPAYSILFVPIALLPVQAARLVWLVIGVAASIAAAKLSTRWTRLSFPISLLALYAFPPMVYSLVAGQISAISLLIFAIVAGMEWHKMDGFLPGMITGLAFYKPQMLIPIFMYWLIRRRWRSLAGLGFSALMVLFISVLISPDATLAYFQFSRQFMELSENATKTGANASIYALHPWAGILTGMGILIVIIFLAQREPDRYSYAMLWLAPILVTPYIVVYDLLLLALPLSFLIPLISRDRLLQAAVVLVWITPLLAIAILSTRPVTFSALGLFGVCAWRFYKNPRLLGDQKN